MSLSHLHEIEGVRSVINLAVAQRLQQAVGHKLDVLRHVLGVHPDQVYGQRVGHKLLLNLYRVADDACTRSSLSLFWRLRYHVAEPSP